MTHIYEAITGHTAPSELGEVVTGTGTIAIATYNGPNFREGFNYLVDATITQVCTSSSFCRYTTLFFVLEFFVHAFLFMCIALVYLFSF